MKKMNPKVTLPLKDQFLTQYYRQGWRGFSKLWFSLKKMGSAPYLQVNNKYGAKFYLNPENYIDSYVIKSGYYESEVLEAILPFLEPQAVFWDIGANFGLHGITAKFLKPETQVVCIEPSPLMFAQIQGNCQLNDLNVQIINLALSDFSHYQNLYLLEGNPGMSTLKPWDKVNYSCEVLSWCDTGDNLVLNQLLPQPTVIKVDVEGSELEVLKGLKTVCENSKLKAVIFEEHKNLVQQPQHPIHEFLTQVGFSIQVLERQEETHHNLENFIAVR